MKRLEKVKEEELMDIYQENEQRQNELREEFEQKEKLLAE